ncbi:hypothetical protein NEQG_00657, partial [Nematocida parisii ERTm3]
MEEHRAEEYSLELLSDNDTKKVYFIGDVCTIGTSNKSDVKVSHTETLECVINYKQDSLRVITGKIKMNGEVITEQVRIHYPCIIEAANKLFRITKTVKDQKPDLTRFSKPENNSENNSDEYSDNTTEYNTHTIKNNDSILSDADINECQLYTKEAMETISNFWGDIEFDSNDLYSDKELEPEMYSDTEQAEEEAEGVQVEEGA